MAQNIQIKRSTTTAAPTSLANGELAYSAISGGDHKLFIGRPGGATGDIDAIGGRFYTTIIENATDANTVSTLVLRDSNGDFAAGTISAALTGNATTATTLATSRNFTVSGDATTASAQGFDGSGNVDLAITLANSGVGAGTFGSATAIPVITVDSKGRITTLTTSSITTTLSIAGDSGTDSDGISLADDTLTFTGGTGVSTTVTDNEVTFAIGQSVETGDDVEFNDVTVAGTLYSNDVTTPAIAGTDTAGTDLILKAGQGTGTGAGGKVVLQTAPASDTSGTASNALANALEVDSDGNVTVYGNLTVSGGTTTVSSDNVGVGDSIIVLNDDIAVDATPSENGGIEINRGVSDNVSLVFDESNDRWKFTNDGSAYNNIPISTEYDNYNHFTVSAGGTTTDIGSDDTVTFTGTRLTVTETGGTIDYAVAVATHSVQGIASFTDGDFDVVNGVVSIDTIDGGTY